MVLLFFYNDVQSTNQKCYLFLNTPSQAVFNEFVANFYKVKKDYRILVQSTYKGPCLTHRLPQVILKVSDLILFGMGVAFLAMSCTHSNSIKFLFTSVGFFVAAWIVSQVSQIALMCHYVYVNEYETNGLLDYLKLNMDLMNRVYLYGVMHLGYSQEYRVIEEV